MYKKLQSNLDQKMLDINIDLHSFYSNKEDYIDKAVTLAQNPQMLLDLRKGLFKNALKTPLFDKTSFSNEFFSSLEKIYN